MSTSVQQGPPKITPKPKGKQPFLIEFYRSSMGKKFVMAVTGLMMLGFVLSHLAGNLKVYLGAEDINFYGEFLRTFGYPLLPKTMLLWILRLGILGAFVMHIHAAASLSLVNRRSRPPAQAYQDRDWIVADFASRSMRWTGIIILLYIVWHLADLTWGVEFVNPDFVRGDVYNNLINSLGRPWVAAIYVVANVALSIHLFHGIWSLFQTMGWNNKRFNSWRRMLSTGIAGLVLVGNLSFPILISANQVGACGVFDDAPAETCEHHEGE